MTKQLSIVSRKSDGSITSWKPTTIDELGRDEAFLEDVLAGSPQILQSQSRRSGIREPFHVVRQLGLRNPSGRFIYPDITLLSASGHVIVVEVKKSTNPELRDRSVIAQIIDYAASFVDLDQEAALALFDQSSAVDTWGDLIVKLFPDESNPQELAELLLERMSSGQINLVIACDKTPPGLREIVRGVAQQNSLGFDLELLEVTPYVGGPGGEILFVPSTELSTEIVARTAITVTYQQGDARPSTQVETSSMEEIEENLRRAGESRVWTVEETEAAFKAEGTPAVLELFEFAKKHSHHGQVISPSPKKLATFGLYMPIVFSDGTRRVRMMFSCTEGWSAVSIYLSRIERFIAPELAVEFRTRLGRIFGSAVNTELSDPSVYYSDLSEHLGEFQELILWLMENASTGK